MSKFPNIKHQIDRIEQDNLKLIQKANQSLDADIALLRSELNSLEQIGTWLENTENYSVINHIENAIYNAYLLGKNLQIAVHQQKLQDIVNS